MSTIVKNPPCEAPAGALLLPAAFHAPEAPSRAKVRRSRMGRRRAAVLIALHLALFAHILHWQLAGETLSPLEPSEAMFTVAQGVINAGFLLLCATVLSTMVFGRWFCGWACHLLALQDLSSWLLGRFGLRPRPIRSRWLVYVPLAGALFMFLINPIGARLADGLGMPSLRVELVKEHFWETFPGLALAAITFFVCGFFIVWLLGSKGFCTYACPYGGLFRVADRFAPGRIRVTDACKGCGHCTAVCSSNVLVHKEVAEYKMVVDPGCMKCGDCISVCPEGALYFGFGRPALFAKARRKLKITPSGTLSRREEVLALAVFVAAILIYTGIPAWLMHGLDKLYGRMPLLLALASASVTAFSAVFLLRILRHPELTLQNRCLKRAGRLTRSGWGVGAILCGVLLFAAHSGLVQYNVFAGMRAFDRTQIGEVAWTQNPAEQDALPADVRTASAAARRHFERAMAIGLAADLRLVLNLAWLSLVDGDTAGAERAYESALELAPTHVPSLIHLARVQVVRNDLPGATATLERLVALVPNDPSYRERLGSTYLAVGRRAEAIQQLELGVAIAPDSAFIRLRLGVIRALAANDARSGVDDVRQAVSLAPHDPDIAKWAAEVLSKAGEVEEASELMRRAGAP